MKAISFSKAGSIELIDIPAPQIGPEDVLIDVHYVGLCGSDLNMYRGTFSLGSYPRIPGHEVSGIIVAKGEEVPPKINLGDKVTISPYSNCGICSACLNGRSNACRDNETLGLQRDGAMSEQFAIHYSKVFAANTLSTKELSLVEPLSVGYHAANRGRVKETDTVLVIGCGTIGMGVVAAAARKGATVIVSDIDDGKLAQAQTFGAHYTINSTREDVLTRINELTKNEGVDVAIEAVGLPDTYRMAVEAAAFTGRVVYVGYAKKEVTYDTTNFVRKELDIVGSRNALLVFPAVIKMLEVGGKPFEDLISRIYPVAQTAQALADWSEAPGKFTKILIDLKA